MILKQPYNVLEVTFEAFEPTWFWSVDEDRKIKEYDFLYKYPPSRLKHLEC